MITEISTVIEKVFIAKDVFILRVSAPRIAEAIKPSQFCNLKVSDSIYPLLRRPFSVSDVSEEKLSFMIQISGEGTELLARKNRGDKVDIIGPLGNGFNIEGNYETAIFVAGGIGAAPFPYMNRLLKYNKKILSIVGGRTKDLVIKYGMDNICVATDDGSEGFEGNAVELLSRELKNFNKRSVKVFGCGPTPMLRALSIYCNDNDIDCEISTESAMACGFGICMGCPVQPVDGGEYKLICKDGPVFNSKEIIL